MLKKLLEVCTSKVRTVPRKIGTQLLKRESILQGNGLKSFPTFIRYIYLSTSKIRNKKSTNQFSDNISFFAFIFEEKVLQKGSKVNQSKRLVCVY